MAKLKDKGLLRQTQLFRFNHAKTNSLSQRQNREKEAKNER